MRTPNRKHIRKGILKRYSLKTRFGDFYSTGAEVDGFVRVYDRDAKTWIAVPEGYFDKEFEIEPGSIDRLLIQIRDYYDRGDIPQSPGAQRLNEMIKRRLTRS